MAPGERGAGGGRGASASRSTPCAQGRGAAASFFPEDVKSRGRDHVKVGDGEPLSPQESNLGGKDSEIPAAGAIACPLVRPHLQTFGDTCHLGSDGPRVAHRPQGDEDFVDQCAPGRRLDRRPRGRQREDGASGEPTSRKGRLRLEEGPGGGVETRGVSGAKA